MKSLQIEFPKTDESLEQNEEFFILRGNPDEIIQFHDYERIYKTPGLYEKVFYEELDCQSPKVISQMLFDIIEDQGANTQDLRILDFGAGNGLVAEALQSKNPEIIVGVDIIEEAKNAAFRDRSEVYEEYKVTDLAMPEGDVLTELKSYDLNTLVSVAAMGFDHIPPDSFVNAFNIIENDGWIAINLRNKFLTPDDETGFNETLQWMSEEYMEILDKKTYVHRLSVQGKPIHYTAIVAKKVSDIVLGPAFEQKKLEIENNRFN